MEDDCYLRFLKLDPLPSNYSKILFVYWKCGDNEGKTKSVRTVNGVANFKKEAVLLVLIILISKINILYIK
jgi:hypothetical protein